MSDKVDVDIDIVSLSKVEPTVLAALRVGQRLALTRQGEGAVPSFSTEAGVELAPLADPQLAARFPHPKVIVRAIKREVATGAIQQLQVRVYRADDGGTATAGIAGGSRTAADAGGPQHAATTAAGDAAAVGSTESDSEYKLRRAQYQALADSPELRALLADPGLQAVLAKIDGAPDREQALAAQLENPGFQGFVSQVLINLDPGHVPATAATAAAVAMATQ